MLNLEKSKTVVMWAGWTTLFILTLGIVVPALLDGHGFDVVVPTLVFGVGFLMAAIAAGACFITDGRNETAVTLLGVALHQTVALAVWVLVGWMGGGVIGLLCLLVMSGLLLVSVKYPLAYHGISIAGVVGTIGGIAIGWPVAAFMAVCAVLGGLLVAWGRKAPTTATININ